MKMAILDEYAYVKKHVETVSFLFDELAPIEALYKTAGLNTTLMPNRIPAINSLITEINSYQDTHMRKTDKHTDVVPPNRETRYATTPAGGYTHDKSGLAVKWQDDPDMWKQFGAAFGAEQPNLATVAARGKDRQLPLSVLPWAKAKAMLPAPLLKLIFDVRFQLEAGAIGTVDERTADQKQRKVVSPNEPGTLRSYHQDSPQVLPPNQFAQGVPQGQATTLHQHYDANSQSGAGSSIKAGREHPEGYAEYTGTGSNWEHNTKVVLDYTRKKVYLTLSHYQYWALIDKQGGGHHMKVGDTQDADQAGIIIQAYIKTKKADENLLDTYTLFSPWLEILTS
jgi:hypothetical protein